MTGKIADALLRNYKTLGERERQGMRAFKCKQVSKSTESAMREREREREREGQK